MKLSVCTFIVFEVPFVRLGFNYQALAIRPILMTHVRSSVTPFYPQQHNRPTIVCLKQSEVISAVSSSRILACRASWKREKMLPADHRDLNGLIRLSVANIYCLRCFQRNRTSFIGTCLGRQYTRTLAYPKLYYSVNLISEHSITRIFRYTNTAP